ncbi:hypothetical protein HRI_004784800 [Hibiscus trionum]|uniref:Uncharacterized protein n=1 Tax=Hibiscus trionum TaxID=183268 RepID=A0A9W7MVM7_HIBTR|nr:hypothetical protein HRI_004784800 [Hibiscus trionum]
MEESGRRKRKMGNEEEKDDEDDDEEKKVEKFFALIRSTREVRDRLRNVAVPNGSKEEEYRKKKEEEEKAAAADCGGRWNPTFQPEDFMENSVSGSKNHLALNDAGPSSEIKHGPEKEGKDGGGEGGGGLDLNLSLSL